MGPLEKLSQGKKAQPSLKDLLAALNLNAGGDDEAFGGRLGLNDLPITERLLATLGASGYYSPKYKEGQFDTYDAALKYYLGKNRQHEVGVSAQGLNTEDPRYMLNYRLGF